MYSRPVCMLIVCNIRNCLQQWQDCKGKMHVCHAWASYHRSTAWQFGSGTCHIEVPFQQGCLLVLGLRCGTLGMISDIQIIHQASSHSLSIRRGSYAQHGASSELQQLIQRRPVTPFQTEWAALLPRVAPKPPAMLLATMFPIRPANLLT